MSTITHGGGDDRMSFHGSGGADGRYYSSYKRFGFGGEGTKPYHEQLKAHAKEIEERRRILTEHIRP